MKFILIFGFIFTIGFESFAGLSFEQEQSRLNDIANKFKGNSDKQRALRCQAFGQFLLENKGQDEILMLKDEPVFSVKSMDLPAFNKVSESTLQTYNDLFNSCRFEINKSFIGFCPECKSLQRVLIPIYIVQKIDEMNYFSNFTDTTRGLNLSAKFAVIETDKPKTKSGQYSTVLLQSGRENFKMLNGFDKKQDVTLEIGYSRASAVFCRFNEFISSMKARYKGMFRCGYYLNDSDFYESSSASLICAPADQFDKSGKDKKKNLWIQDFDYQYCRDK